MNLAICVATMKPQAVEPPGDIQSWLNWSSPGNTPVVNIRYNSPGDNLGVAASYDQLYRETTQDILCYLHDDVICREDRWDERILMEFEDPAVGIVGAGGALQHGSSDIYKTPYRLQQLGRSGYLSNVDDAEVHGRRFTGACDVAVLDGFMLCVRRELLDRTRGWTSLPDAANFFCYDYAIAALAHRLGYRVRVVGLRCHHRGGQSSTKEKNKMTSQDSYDESHRWFYEEFRDVMPWRCI